MPNNFQNAQVRDPLLNSGQAATHDDMKGRTQNRAWQPAMLQRTKAGNIKKSVAKKLTDL